MTPFKNRVLNLVKIFHSIKDENLQWQEYNQERQHRLKTAHLLAEQELAAELKKRSAQLAHDLSLLKARHETDLKMFKTKCQQDVKDYQQYLDSLDRLKHSIQTSYAHLPEAVAFTIHHHAKFLLHKMWEADDYEQKMRHELELIQFMTAVHEDARRLLEGKEAGHLPENTLKLIEERR